MEQQLRPGPPVDPTAATTAEQFVRALAQLRLWAGQPSLERLRSLSDALAPATISETLNGKRLPRLPRLRFVEAFVAACLVARNGRSADVRPEVERWMEAWHRLAVAAAPARPDNGRKDAPRHLPSPVIAFTGRAGDLLRLDELSRNDDLPTIVVITGTAGVGKTALAVTWAHRLAERYGDGQLYVNLHGYDAAEPLVAQTAVEQLLRALDVEHLPPDPEERTHLYHRVLTGKRLLIVLDNARSVDQLRPLLPHQGGHLVLITSRDNLAGLVTREGAHRLIVDRFSTAEATDLLRLLVPDRQSPHDAAAYATLNQHCAGLPLTLRIAAERLTARPHATLDDLVGELDEETLRLDLLDAGGDASTDIRSVFSWSYQALPAPAARLFRLLGLLTGVGFDAHVAANLGGIPLREARQALETLRRGCLIEEPRPGRYVLHDLLRAYAAELAHQHDERLAREAALTGVLDWYLHTARAAAHSIADLLDLRSLELAEPAPVPSVIRPDFASAAEALDWLETERVNLVAAVRQAEAARLPHAWLLPHALRPFFSARGYVEDWLHTHRTALRAAEHQGDAVAQAVTLTHLGYAHGWLRDRGEAQSYLRRALDTFRAADHRRGMALALTGLSDTLLDDGRYAEALAHYEQANAQCQEIGDLATGALARLGLGRAHFHLGDYEQALACHHELLDLAQLMNVRRGEAFVRILLGATYLRIGQYGEARAHFEQALVISGEISDRVTETLSLTGVGAVEVVAGEPLKALHHHHRALELSRRAAQPLLECRVLNNLADAYTATGDLGQADEHRRQALALATRIGARYEQDQALRQAT